MLKQNYELKMAAYNNAKQSKFASFIEKGTAATEIIISKNNRKAKAAIVYNNKEGADDCFVYTYLEKIKNRELFVGDYFVWDNQAFFIFQDIKIIKNAIFKKQKAYECNITFSIGEESYYGYFISSLKSFVGTNLKQDFVLFNNEKPILIIPSSLNLDKNDKIKIENKQYKIVDIDNISNGGISYLSLEFTFSEKAYTIIEENAEPIEEINIDSILIAGTTHTITTEGGYYNITPSVKIVQRTIDAISFEVPFGISKLLVKIKESGTIVDKEYIIQ